LANPMITVIIKARERIPPVKLLYYNSFSYRSISLE
jgi:hypothetical protein